MPSMFQIVELSTRYSLMTCFSAEETTEALPLDASGMILLQGDLHNASYHVELDYPDGSQTIAVQSKRMKALEIVDSVLGSFVGI